MSDEKKSPTSWSVKNTAATPIGGVTTMAAEPKLQNAMDVALRRVMRSPKANFILCRGPFWVAWQWSLGNRKRPPRATTKAIGGARGR